MQLRPRPPLQQRSTRTAGDKPTRQIRRAPTISVVSLGGCTVFIAVLPIMQDDVVVTLVFGNTVERKSLASLGIIPGQSTYSDLEAKTIQFFLDLNKDNDTYNPQVHTRMQVMIDGSSKVTSDMNHLVIPRTVKSFLCLPESVEESSRTTEQKKAGQARNAPIRSQDRRLRAEESDSDPVGILLSLTKEIPSEWVEKANLETAISPLSNVTDEQYKLFQRTPSSGDSMGLAVHILTIPQSVAACTLGLLIVIGGSILAAQDFGIDDDVVAICGSFVSVVGGLLMTWAALACFVAHFVDSPLHKSLGQFRIWLLVSAVLSRTAPFESRCTPQGVYVVLVLFNLIWLASMGSAYHADNFSIVRGVYGLFLLTLCALHTFHYVATVRAEIAVWFVHSITAPAKDSKPTKQNGFDCETKSLDADDEKQMSDANNIIAPLESSGAYRWLSVVWPDGARAIRQRESLPELPAWMSLVDACAVACCLPSSESLLRVVNNTYGILTLDHWLIHMDVQLLNRLSHMRILEASPHKEWSADAASRAAWLSGDDESGSTLSSDLSDLEGSFRRILFPQWRRAVSQLQPIRKFFDRYDRSFVLHLTVCLFGGALRTIAWQQDVDVGNYRHLISATGIMLSVVGGALLVHQFIMNIAHTLPLVGLGDDSFDLELPKNLFEKSRKDIFVHHLRHSFVAANAESISLFLNGFWLTCYGVRLATSVLGERPKEFWQGNPEVQNVSEPDNAFEVVKALGILIFVCGVASWWRFLNACQFVTIALDSVIERGERLKAVIAEADGNDNPEHISGEVGQPQGSKGQPNLDNHHAEQVASQTRRGDGDEDAKDQAGTGQTCLGRRFFLSPAAHVWYYERAAMLNSLSADQYDGSLDSFPYWFSFICFVVIQICILIMGIVLSADADGSGLGYLNLVIGLTICGFIIYTSYLLTQYLNGRFSQKIAQGSASLALMAENRDLFLRNFSSEIYHL